MEFTELTDYPLTGGVLTEWTPRAAGHDPAWTVDDRPLSPLHADYCRRGVDVFGPRSDRDTPGPPGSWLGAVFEVPLPYDAAAVGVALTAWMRRHEVFRTTVTGDGGHPVRVVLDDDVEVAPSIVGSLRTGTRVHEHLVSLFDRLSPWTWPHCVAATISEPTVEHAPLADTPRPDDRFLLVFAADHSVMDAYSMLLAIGEIQELYRRAHQGERIDTAPVASHVDFSVADHLAGTRLHRDHHAVVAWREFLQDGEAEQFPAFPLPLGTTASAPARRQSGVSSWVMTADQADRINAAARARGHTMQTVVLAALATATHRCTGNSTTRFVMPLHTRTDPRYAHSVGWFVGMVPITVDLGAATTVDERLALAAAEIGRRRPLAPHPYPCVAEINGSRATPRFVVSYVDTRRIPGAQEWTRWGARTLRGASVSDDEVYLWIVRSPKGISLSARFPSTAVAADSVHRHLHALREVVADMGRELGVDDRDPIERDPAGRRADTRVSAGPDTEGARR
ncbi:condensation domain-containing protein [Williamsia deligens]|uniref:Condensation domain-containing protein n=1 Tax=Williamsia deligens TaxID=321325 RepID=A0ABW3GB17_9NOCA|nr:condensation domain-containing protein [Williamsia deligens]MCP2196179.1 Condensation domain-containing protein [Williamsia deligens]